jgi:hypothetical protein
MFTFRLCMEACEYGMKMVRLRILAGASQFMKSTVRTLANFVGRGEKDH